jgi:hypothetical protein
LELSSYNIDEAIFMLKKSVGLKKMILTFGFIILSAFSCIAEPSIALKEDGTQEYPYRINSSSDLMLLAMEVNSGNDNAGKFFKLCNDIDFSGILNYIPIGNVLKPFQGTFDGSDRIISSLLLSGDTDSSGLFGFLGKSGAISNLHLVSVNIKGCNVVGGISGVNEGSISNCSVSGKVEGIFDLHKINRDRKIPGLVMGGYFGIGGIAGINIGTIKTSYSIASIKGNENDENDISAITVSGGIVGANAGSVTTSYFVGNIAGPSAGGIAGHNEGSITDSYVAGGIIGKWPAGGIVNSNESGFEAPGIYTPTAQILNCHFDIQGTGRMKVSHGDDDDRMSGIDTRDTRWADSRIFPESEWVVVPGYYPQLRVMAESNNVAVRVASALSVVPVYLSAGDRVDRVRSGFTIPTETSLKKNLTWTSDNEDVIFFESSGISNNIRAVQFIAGLQGATLLSVADEWGNTKTFVLNIDTAAAPGDGTREKPYLLSTPADLIALATDVNKGKDYAGKFFTLSNDIDLSRIANWKPIGDFINKFQGTFDGASKVISNMKISIDTNDTNMIGIFTRGLFGQIGSSGLVKSLHLVSVDIKGPGTLGGIAGCNEGTVNDCSVSGKIEGGGQGLTGGIVGLNVGIVKTVHSTCTLSGNETVGGITGRNVQEGIVVTSYATGSIRGNRSVGGIAGYNNGTVKSCYSTCVLDGKESVGGIVGNNSAEGIVMDSYAAGSIRGNHKVGGIAGVNKGEKKAINGLFDFQGTGWHNTTGDEPSAENKVSTQDNCWTDSQIFPDSEWIVAPGYYPQLRVMYESDNATVRGASALSVVPIYLSTGDRADRVRSGFTIPTETLSKMNLTWTSDNADVVFSESPGTSGIRTVQFPARLQSTVTLKAVDAWGNAKVFILDIDAVAAQGDGTREKPYLLSTPADLIALAVEVNNGNEYAGKFFTLSNDIDLSGITSWSPIGNDNTGRFQGTFDGAGRIIFHFIISANSDAGLFGDVGSGGMVKNLHLVSADVKGYGLVGGIVASNNGIVSGCSVSGRISGGGDSVNCTGGIVGYNLNVVVGSYSTCSVNGNETVGGIAGFNAGGTVMSGYSTGTISGNNSIGGVVGVNAGVIANTYATGNVQGNERVGGITGVNSGSVRNSYVVGLVEGKSKVGGIAGVNRDEIANCFVNPQRTRLTEASGTGRGKETVTKLNTGDSGWWNPANFPADHWHVRPGYYPQIMTMVDANNSNVNSPKN